MISGITSQSSKSASESVGWAAEFYINHSYYGLHMVKVKDTPDETSPEFFDGIAVFAVPLNDMKKAALVTEKLTHSIVLMINSKSGKGLMLEYTNNDNKGVVQVAPGRLAKQKYCHTRSPYGQYRSLSNGFYECHMTFDRLKEFNKWFIGLSNYHMVVHNCHIYHRSLVASAVMDTFMYNYKEQKSFFNQFWVSNKWFHIETVRLRCEIHSGLLLTFTLGEQVRPKSMSDTTINSVAIDYDDCCHTAIAPKNMDLGLFRDTWSKEMTAKIEEAISSNDQVQLVELLRECSTSNHVSDSIIRALNHLFPRQISELLPITNEDLLWIRELSEINRWALGSLSFFDLEMYMQKLEKAVKIKSELDLQSSIEYCRCRLQSYPLLIEGQTCCDEIQRIKTELREGNTVEDLTLAFERGKEFIFHDYENVIRSNKEKLSIKKELNRAESVNALYMVIQRCSQSRYINYQKDIDEAQKILSIKINAEQPSTVQSVSNAITQCRDMKYSGFEEDLEKLEQKLKRFTAFQAQRRRAKFCFCALILGIASYYLPYNAYILTSLSLVLLIFIVFV